jgi:antitoxin (DNA-binding transcriptional repressor) of toxin-antitoxin stability system
VKTISIKELHATTGRYVREAAEHAVYVTDRGALVAVLKPVVGEDLPGRPFPRRRACDLPSAGVDSTAGISAERDGR